MTAIIGTVLLGIVVILSVALIFGAPLGDLTMGGQHKVFPGKLRLVLVSQLIVQVLFALILLQLGGYMEPWFSHKVTKIIGIILAIYLSVNTLANLFSKSKKERIFMTPLSAVTAVCFWINAIGF